MDNLTRVKGDANTGGLAAVECLMALWPAMQAAPFGSPKWWSLADDLADALIAVRFARRLHHSANDLRDSFAGHVAAEHRP